MAYRYTSEEYIGEILLQLQISTLNGCHVCLGLQCACVWPVNYFRFRLSPERQNKSTWRGCCQNTAMWFNDIVAALEKDTLKFSLKSEQLSHLRHACKGNNTFGTASWNVLGSSHSLWIMWVSWHSMPWKCNAVFLFLIDKYVLENLSLLKPYHLFSFHFYFIKQLFIYFKHSLPFKFYSESRLNFFQNISTPQLSYWIKQICDKLHPTTFIYII